MAGYTISGTKAGDKLDSEVVASALEALKIYRKMKEQYGAASAIGPDGTFLTEEELKILSEI